MKLIQTDPKENARLYVLLLLLVTLSFYLVAVRPAATALKVEAAKYETVRQEISTGRTQAKELLSYARRVGKLKSEVIGLEQKLLAGNQVLLLLKDAENAAGHADVALGDVNPQAPEVKADVTRQPVAVSASGQLYPLLHFVQHLEQLAYPLRVVELDLTTGGEPGKLEAKVQLELYSLSEGGQTAVAAEAPKAGGAQ